MEGGLEGSVALTHWGHRVYQDLGLTISTQLAASSVFHLSPLFVSLKCRPKGLTSRFLSDLRSTKNGSIHTPWFGPWTIPLRNPRPALREGVTAEQFHSCQRYLTEGLIISSADSDGEPPPCYFHRGWKRLQVLWARQICRLFEREPELPTHQDLREGWQTL